MKLDFELTELEANMIYYALVRIARTYEAEHKTEQAKEARDLADKFAELIIKSIAP
jgi:hypothetical protein